MEPKKTVGTENDAVVSKVVRLRLSPGAEPSGGSVLPDPEVPDRPVRRRFTAEYKRRVLQEADRCQPGELGALLRREGLYSSLLSKWRQQRERAEREALAPKKRGRKPNRRDPAAEHIAELERENQRLRKHLQEAEAIIEVQKKISDLLGIVTKPENS